MHLTISTKEEDTQREITQINHNKSSARSYIGMKTRIKKGITTAKHLQRPCCVTKISEKKNPRLYFKAEDSFIKACGITPLCSSCRQGCFSRCLHDMRMLQRKPPCPLPRLQYPYRPGLSSCPSDARYNLRSCNQMRMCRQSSCHPL